MANKFSMIVTKVSIWFRFGVIKSWFWKRNQKKD